MNRLTVILAVVLSVALVFSVASRANPVSPSQFSSWVLKSVLGYKCAAMTCYGGWSDDTI